jgi:phosphate transport system protein
MNEHILEKFDAELDKLRSRLIKMGTLVQQQMQQINQALINNDKKLADFIISNDDKIDKMDIRIDKQCMRIFALHQPVASDLRIVMSALSINTNMELAGDIIVDIARGVLVLPEPPLTVDKMKLTELCRQVENMIVRSVDSFIYSSVELSYEVLESYPHIRDLFYANAAYLLSKMKENPDNIEYCTMMNDVNRNMKFISDLAMNIAHEIIFIVEAKIVKHHNPLGSRDIYDDDDSAE